MIDFTIIFSKDDNWSPTHTQRGRDSADAVARALDASPVDYGWTQAFVIDPTRTRVDRYTLTPERVIPRAITSDRRNG